MTETSNEKQTVLIVGGGIGGLSAIAGLRKLDTEVNILLVEPKDHMEIYWASYRSPFEEWVAEDSLIMLDKFCEKHNVQHIRDVVLKIDEGKATLKEGGERNFDVCCVATGANTKWDGLGRGLPKNNGTREERLKDLKATGEEVLNAGSVLIVGGSLIGSELAGDIAGYAQKANKPIDITLVHSGPYLCPVMGEAAGNMVQRKLEALGVKVYLNDKAVEGPNSTMRLETSGETLTANKVIMAVGFVAMNSLLAHLEGALDDQGWIQTDQHFRVQGTKSIFAIGDCTTTLPNSGNQVMRNVSIIGNNLKAALEEAQQAEGTTKTKLQDYQVGLQIYCTTTGPDTGVFWSPWFYTQYMLPWIKNATMFFMAPKDMIGIQK